MGCRAWSHLQCTHLTQRTAKAAKFHCHICRKGAPSSGRPTKESNKGITNAIVRKAPESWNLSLSRFLPPTTNISLTDSTLLIDPWRHHVESCYVLTVLATDYAL